MIPGWLAEAANRFWEKAGSPPPFPRDLGEVLPFALPVYQIVMPRLRLRGADDWLLRHGWGARIADHDDRRLHGAVAALNGHGFLFVDGADVPAERRFTLAHEAAHFLLDYLEPRQRAIVRLGPGIVPVLDGQRPPTRIERIDAALAACPTGLHLYLLERDESTGRVVRIEHRVDRLACELLAPDEELERRYGAVSPDAMTLAADLETEFGLPLSVSGPYAAAWLAPRRQPAFLSGFRR